MNNKFFILKTLFILSVILNQNAVDFQWKNANYTFDTKNNKYWKEHPNSKSVEGRQITKEEYNKALQEYQSSQSK